MIVNMDTANNLDKNEYLIDIVKAQLTNRLIKPRNKVIVNKKLTCKVDDTVLRSPTCQAVLPDFGIYLWDCKKDENLLEYFIRKFKDVTIEQLNEVFSYFNIPHNLGYSLITMSQYEVTRNRIFVEIKKLEKELDANKLKLEIIRLFFVLHKSVTEICSLKQMSKPSINSILLDYKRGKLPFGNTYSAKRLEIKTILLDNSLFILSNFKKGYS